MTNTMTAAERYRQTVNETLEIVDVTTPSGFVFQFQKPSKFAILFRYGRMPQTAANGAVSAWIEQGVIKESDFTPDEAAAIDESLRLRDRVLELSHSPKLVVGAADFTKDEMSTDDLSDDDALYLMQWVAAGGDESVLLSMFPGGQRPDPLAKFSRKKRRAASK